MIKINLAFTFIIFSLFYFFTSTNFVFATSVISSKNSLDDISNIDFDSVSIISISDGKESISDSKESLLSVSELSSLTNYTTSEQDDSNTINDILKIYQLLPDLDYVKTYDLNGDLKFYLNINQEVTLLEKIENWLKILYQDTELFINLDEISSDQTSYSYAIVTSYDGLNLRLEPSTNSEIIKVLSYGESVQLIQLLDDWAYVQDDSGQVGYLSTDFIQLSQDNSSISQKTEYLSQDANSIIEYATQFLGNPYVFGGTSLQTGTDCSGFIYYIFQHFGIDLPRTSKEQFSTGEFVLKQDLQPGDLVFFSSGDENNISHIGIYIGNDQYIHSSEEQYGVIISSLNNPYSLKYYFGARRIIN